jgi:hypothetical protein
MIALCAVAEIGEIGLPSGYLYAHLMGQGVSLDEHETIVGAMVKMKWATKTGHVLRATEKGKELAKKVEAALKT